MTPTQIARQEDRRAWLEFRDQARKQQERRRRWHDVCMGFLFAVMVWGIVMACWWVLG